MKIQFNLLPDIKQQYIKAQRTKRLITTVAVLVSIGCIILLVLMMSIVYGVNKLQLSNADKSIDNYKQQLNAIPSLNKILTVQAQLSALLTLQQNKSAVSRLFGYVTELTPTAAKIGRIQMDTTLDSLQISGTADTQKTVNTYIDTLKFTTYNLNGQNTNKNAFPSVIESNFGIDQRGASYTLDIQYDPALFANVDSVSLNIPSGVTTRSVLDDPLNALFNGKTNSLPSTTSGSSNSSSNTSSTSNNTSNSSSTPSSSAGSGTNSGGGQ